MEELADRRSRAQAVSNDKSVTLSDISTVSPEELQKLVHELQIHQVELESQNEELRKVQGGLSESRDRYFDLYNFAPVGYLTVSKGCNILEANQTASRLLGIERDQLIGKPLYCLIAKEDQDFFYFHLMTVFRNQATTTCELKLKRNDGTEFYAKLQSHALKGFNGAYNSFRTIVSDITERKNVQEALRASEERFRTMFERHSAVMLLIEPETGRIMDANISAERFYGYTISQLQSMCIQEINILPSVEVEAQRSLALKERRNYFVFPHRLANGEVRKVEVHSSPIKLNGTNTLFSIIHDITDREIAENALRESEEKFSKVFQFGPALMTLSKVDDGTYVEVNDKFCEASGFTRAECIGKKAVDFGWISEEERKRLFAELHTHGSVRALDLEVRSKDKRKIHLIYYGELIQTERRPLLLSIAQDITDRKQTEEALRSSEAQKSAILNGISANIAFVNDKLEILWANRTSAESVGRLPEEMIGPTCHSLWADPERPCANCPTVKAFQTRGSQKAIMTTPDGRIWDERAEPVFDDSGNLIGVVELAQDITEYKRLTDQEKLLSTAIEQAAEAVVITDATGTIQYVNPAAEVADGYRIDELIGQGVDIFKSGKHDNNFYKELWETINAGNVWSGRFINKKKDGTEYHEDATISPVYDKSGNLTNFVSVRHDITKQLELQQQLLQAQKMEAIGTLASGFAHDFNNKLQVISGCAELILYNKDLPEAIVNDIGIIKQTLDSSAELIKGMMVFSRKTPIELQPIELNKLITQNTSMLARSISKMIEIDLFLADDLWTIKAAPNQIDQILMNLAVNAADAMPNGGNLTIKTNNIVLDAEFCRPYPNNKPGRYALITISDAGAGMDKETVSHIFEPFFTTKEAGKGTGLGLAVVYGIVEQHGGRIICDSTPSKGTTFRIYFPAIEEVPEEQYPANKEAPRGQGETILLVDDEPDFLKITSQILNKANYRVITASHGKEALELYKKHRAEIKLVVLDLLMPGMEWKDCLRALLRIDPTVRVLIATGYTKSGMTQELLVAGVKDFILKPFNILRFGEKIRKIIDEG